MSLARPKAKKKKKEKIQNLKNLGVDQLQLH